MNGFDKILYKIQENPHLDIYKDRYMALVGEVDNLNEKYNRIIELVDILLAYDPDEAFDYANMSYKLDQSRPEALERVIKALELQGEFDKLRAVKDQLAIIKKNMCYQEDDEDYTQVNYSGYEDNSNANQFDNDKKNRTSVNIRLKNIPAVDQLLDDSETETSEGELESDDNFTSISDIIYQQAEVSGNNQLNSEKIESSSVEPIEYPETKKQEKRFVPTFSVPEYSLNSMLESKVNQPQNKISEPKIDINVPSIPQIENFSDYLDNNLSDKISKNIESNDASEDEYQVTDKHIKYVFIEILTKQLEEYSSNIRFKSPKSLKLIYKDDWTKAEFSIFINALIDCHTEILHEFIRVNWEQVPDRHGLLLLEGLDVMDESPELWGIYHDCMIAVGLARKSLSEMRSFLNKKQDDVWGCVAWQRIQKIYKQLDFYLFSWQESEGIESLKNKLGKRPKLSYSLLFSSEFMKNHRRIAS